ncbi:Kinetochore-associated MTW1 [Hyphodiscus hymeniophilus]|uniref:Kinetochore-associated MTW1 n=1 Tax=Hyphodiscus hymeniophilus TaxID=353542 RepID=A0A9P6VPL5_9HELO|nr:Kinetochore-associated MTW1 [Hyphodiscus hymeniophilus]
MNEPVQSDTTMLTEHFTYRPVALIDDIVNSINTLTFRATDAVEKGLLSADPSNLGFQIPSRNTPEDENATAIIRDTITVEVENGVHQLETLLEAKIDRNFDKLEILALRNHLSVPPELRDWVRLGHYQGLNFTVDGDAPSTTSITLQRKKLREVEKLHSLLLAETARNEATIDSIRGLLSKQVLKREPSEDTQAAHPTFAFLQDKGGLKGDVSHPISTTTSFALSQLPALKSLLQNLKPRLDELVNDNGQEGLVGEEEKSWKRERLEFVEKEARRHLENVRGLELGDMGEVRDGEWQGEGRKLGKEEVEDLERVVKLVGGGDAMDES